MCGEPQVLFAMVMGPLARRALKPSILASSAAWGEGRVRGKR